VKSKKQRDLKYSCFGKHVSGIGSVHEVRGLLFRMCGY